MSTVTTRSTPALDRQLTEAMGRITDRFVHCAHCAKSCRYSVTMAWEHRNADGSASHDYAELQVCEDHIAHELASVRNLTASNGTPVMVRVVYLGID